MNTKKSRKAQFIKQGYSPYHARIAADPDKVVAQDFAQKRGEIQKVLPKIRPAKGNINIAVLGCADGRYVEHYTDFFEDIFGIPCQVDIYELTTVHLPKAANIFQFDCTEQLPKKYDFIYSHLLLNFMPAEQQVELITNSYKSLKSNGSVLHVYASNKDADCFSADFKTVKLDKDAKNRAGELTSRSKSKRLVLQRSQPYF